VLVEQLHKLGKVSQRAGEAVHLVDHHHVDEPGLDVSQQLLEAGRSMLPPE
jgi:hypothetical protein